jgi:dihydrofolate reductase
MRKIVACLFCSVDGVVGEPAEWLTMSDDLAASVAARSASTDTILLGRATYEQFAGQWPYRTGAMADFMNGTRKLVVTTSLHAARWQNADLIDANASIGEGLARLQRAPGNDILVLGSATLVQCLLRRGMIDELVLLVHPVIRGRGRRLFDEFTGQMPMEQIECVTFESGLVSISYEMNSRGASSPNQQTRRPQAKAREDTIMHATTSPTTRELDHRVNDGLEVKLLWNPVTDRVSVTLEDERTAEFFELDVDPEHALSAFYDPFEYANRAGNDRALAA